MSLPKIAWGRHPDCRTKLLMTYWRLEGNEGKYWIVSKIWVPFWYPEKLGAAIYQNQKGPIILSTTHFGIVYSLIIPTNNQQEEGPPNIRKNITGPSTLRTPTLNRLSQGSVSSSLLLQHL